MQRSLSNLVVLALVLLTTSVTAQELSRKEKCAIKKEIRTYIKHPEKWLALMDSLNHLDQEVTAAQEMVDSVSSEMAVLAVENAATELELAALQEKYQNLLDSMPSILPPNGTVYQVQMGYFKYLDLVSFNNRLKVIKAEEVGGAKRYVIGYFEDVVAALQFASDMKALGIDDAFVTQYVDGERNMQFDALEEIEH